MLTYKVTKIPEIKAFKIEGDFMPGSIPIRIPDDEKLKTKFVSRFLQKNNIEHGIDALKYISTKNKTLVNQALFVFALGNLMKCFQQSAACVMLSEKKFEKGFPDIYPEYIRFKDWRNKHYLHDENSMTEAFAFLLVAPDDTGPKFGGPPSVVWDNVPVDYAKEAECLEKVMQAAWKYCISEIDETGDKLLKQYEPVSRAELLSYGPPKAKEASFDNPNKNRLLD